MRITVKMTADELWDVINAITDEAVEQDIYVDPLYGNDNMEQILKVVDAALSAMGIEVEEDKPEDDEEEIESIIYDCDGKRGISAADARLLMQCVAKTMRKQYPILSDEALEVMGMIECLRIAEVYGIEVVDTEGE